MMTLREVVDRYNALAGRPGEPVPLSDFGLPRDETAALFNSLDEDYHISRYLHFSRSEGQRYSISGDSVTHVAIDTAVTAVL